MSATGAKASLIGAPTDVGASDRGASMGPEALRVAGLVSALTGRGLDVRDCGNLSGPPNPGRAAVGGYRHLAEVAAWNREVHGAVHRELGSERLPILLGGDHSLSIGSISAVARHCRETHRRPAHHLARCAYGLQYRGLEPEREPARHARLLAMRLRAAAS